jgi:hypothetical protein
VTQRAGRCARVISLWFVVLFARTAIAQGIAKPSIGKRAADELKEFLLIAAYLYICFTALAYLKAAILRAQGVEFAPFVVKDAGGQKLA